MGIGFRKRIKVAPGVTFNLSKKGVSTTIGTKGASVNIGKNGIYANAGIPGTGIYARNKIAGGKSSPNNINQSSPSYGGPPSTFAESIVFLGSLVASFIISLAIMFTVSFFAGIGVLVFLCIVILSISNAMDKSKKDKKME